MIDIDTIILTALTVCAIFDTTMITANRLLQNAATVSLFSMSLSLAVELRTPMSYNFARSWASIFERKGSWAERMDIRCANDRRDPQSLLYLSVVGGEYLLE